MFISTIFLQVVNVFFSLDFPQFAEQESTQLKTLGHHFWNPHDWTRPGSGGLLEAQVKSKDSLEVDKEDKVGNICSQWCTKRFL